MTIPALIAAQDAAIRNQTTANSITKTNVTDVLTADTNELLARGKTRVTTTANLATLAGTNYQFADVDGYGLFYYSPTGTPNGTTIFAALTTGVWILYILAGVTPSYPVSSVSNADGSLTISPTTGAVVASINLANSNTFTAAQTVLKANIGAVNTIGFTIQNTTAAAAGSQQQSPQLRFEGRGWKTNATAASQSVTMDIQLLPVQGAANPTANLEFLPRINNAAPFQKMWYDSNGLLNIQGQSSGIAGIALSFGYCGFGASVNNQQSVNIALPMASASTTAITRMNGTITAVGSIEGLDLNVNNSGVTNPGAGTTFSGIQSFIVLQSNLYTTAYQSVNACYYRLNYSSNNASAVVMPELNGTQSSIIFSTGVQKDATLVQGFVSRLSAGDNPPTGKAVTYVAFKADDIQANIVRTNPYGFWQAGTVLLNRFDACTSIGTNAKPAGGAWLELGTGTTTVAPLKFTAGTNLTSPVNGCMEFDGTHLYITIGGSRLTII